VKLLTNVDFLTEALQKAGSYAQGAFMKRQEKLMREHKNEGCSEKSDHELVIAEDLACQDIVVDEIRAVDKDAIIYSEEMDNMDKLVDDRSPIKYILDPLDGTHNFCFGLPFWGISLAVLDENNKPVFGTINIPEMRILLKSLGAEEGTSIWNGSEWEKITTTPRSLKDSVMCYDNQFYKLGEQAFKIYQELTKNCFTTRIAGSASADIALIATGKINARLWNNTNAYDIAAGIPIIQGAGGSVTNFEGKELEIFSKQVIMCSDKKLCNDIIDIIERT